MSQQWNVVKLIQQRESVSYLWSKGIFITISASIFLSSFFLNNLVNYTKINVVSVEKFPLLIPIFIGVLVIALYFSSMAVINITREKERGTLEILLTGPMNESTYIWGMFLAYLKLFIISITVFIIWSLISTLILNMPFRSEILGIFLASIFLATELDALGIFLVSLSKKPKHTLIFFILILLILGAIHLTDELVAQYISSTSSVVSDPLVVIRDILLNTNRILSLFSPFAHFFQAIQELLNENLIGYLGKLFVMFFETLILIIFGSVLLKTKRGQS